MTNDFMTLPERGEFLLCEAAEVEKEQKREREREMEVGSRRRAGGRDRMSPPPNRSSSSLSPSSLSSSANKASVTQQPTRDQRIPPSRRSVQVVYYLTRNGLLEHPHFMEVSLLSTQQLRLRDVMERLTALRGKGMPSMYSWSCKRSYKNGYVWNDLSENDVIFPAEGAEYVLKGSEIIVDSCPAADKYELPHHHISNSGPLIGSSNKGSNRTIRSKRMSMASSRDAPEQSEPAYYPGRYEERERDYEAEEEEEEEECEIVDEEKASYTSSTTPHSRCSRGVSTDELDEEHPQDDVANTTTTTAHQAYKSTLSASPQKSMTTTLTTAPKRKNKIENNGGRGGSNEDGDLVISNSAPSRGNSVLLQLISCGNLAISKAKNVPTTTAITTPSVKQQQQQQQWGRRGGDQCNYNGGSQREVLFKSSAKKAAGLEREVEPEEEVMMIKCMSENPRFGSVQCEEKEYFSGSIVETMTTAMATEAMSKGPMGGGGTEHHRPVLKKSNSYNEDRSLSKAEVVEEKRERSSPKGKCIPRKKSSSARHSYKR